MFLVSSCKGYCETLATIYTFSIFTVTAVLSIVRSRLIEHGRITGGISKMYFFVFYLAGMVVLRNSENYFILHPARRFTETIVYCRESRSRMTYLQFVHGIVYLIFISLYMRDRYVEPFGFILLNILQGIAHYRVYKLRKFEFYHYYTEIAIYLYLFLCNRTCALFFNLLYVIAFVLASKRFRTKSYKKRMIKQD